eukprot:gnl/Chilomastix_cuspidata/2372.p1 GENE.gnl/Chilomastix_cuspidata/2372~~gnl/Chilomastix_cuspidata/2372.p1  ORF type:complete len:203 (+),score=73.47 gnl/Chilomastix_cuspidata/2372:458-1066(+)
MATINVSNLSSDVTEGEVRSFLGHCGEIVFINLNVAEESATAVVKFATENARETALSMSGSSLGGRDVIITSGGTSGAKPPQSRDEPSDQYGVVTDALGKSYAGLHHLGQKIKEGDEKVGASEKVREGAKKGDDKLHVREGAKKIDDKLHVRENAKRANEKTRFTEGIGQLRDTWAASKAGQKVRSVRQETVKKAGVDDSGK